MDTSKFLEEIRALENKLRQKAGGESQRIEFPVLVKQLKDAEEIDEQIVYELKKLWEIRNTIYSSPTPDDNISDKAQTLLVSLINNPKLK